MLRSFNCKTKATLIIYSAGVGRTGTYIALDSLIDQAEKEKKISVQATVHKLRYQRVNMVQTLVSFKYRTKLIPDAISSAVSEFMTHWTCWLPLFSYGHIPGYCLELLTFTVVFTPRVFVFGQDEILCCNFAFIANIHSPVKSPNFKT